MIVRHESDGSTVMITQNDHALVSGLFAAHWGNASFERAHPYQSVVRATSFHDRGWIDYETSPRVHADGHTPNYRDVPNDEKQLRAFRWASDWLSGIDPYAGLLSARHRSGLYQNRYGAITHPALVNRGTLPEDIKTFIAASETQQAQAAVAFNTDELSVNYNLLQVWDMMSLYVCSTPNLAPATIGPAPKNYRGDSVLLSLTPQETNEIQLDPWPFDVPELVANVVYRRLGKQIFVDDADLREAYFKTAPAVMAFRFVNRIHA